MSLVTEPAPRNAWEKASLVIGNGFLVKPGKLGALKPLSALGELDFTRVGDTATRVNEAGDLEEVLANTPRVDFSSGTPIILLEDQRANSIQNNKMIGSETGNPGTLPDRWSVNLAGLNQQILSVGLEKGKEFIDLRFFGVANITSDDALSVAFEPLTGISAIFNQTWTNSLWLKIIEEVHPPQGYRLQIQERNIGGSYLTDSRLAIAPTVNLLRFAQTRPNTNDSVAFVWPRLAIRLTSGQEYDFTIRIALPQMELGNTLSSVIKTANALSTRGADRCNKSNIDSLIGQQEGTLFLDFIYKTPASGDAGQFAVTSPNFPYDRVLIWNNLTINQLAATLQLSSQTVFNLPLGTFTEGMRYKIGFAYKSGDTAAYVNGVKVASSNALFNFTQTLSVMIVGAYEAAMSLNQECIEINLELERVADQEMGKRTTI
ncbi:MAG: hypothetical protein Q8J69_07730 [Sphingobacteriaceae bacterium]|nr:hypothetical protein [Sphingobacteriaceae bacterium]